MDAATTQREAIRFEVTDGIAVATLARPDRRNAFAPDFLEDIERIIAEVGARRDLSAFIMKGSDGVFCAGGDIKGMVARHKEGDTRAEDTRHRLHTDVHGWLQPLRNLEVPVIAAVDGPAFGGGLGLALAADFVLASERATFSSVFCRIGLVPDCSVLYTLPRIVGLQRAKELIHTGRTVGAEEARALGIVMEVHPTAELEDAAMTLARRLANASRTAFGIAKRALNSTFETNAMQSQEFEAAGQAICMDSAYHKDAVDRFVGKQPLRHNWDA